MNGRTRLPFLLALFIAAPVAFSYEYGLSLTNDSTFSVADDPQFEQTNRATLWYSMQNGPSADFYISGFYEFDGTFRESSSDVMPWRVDLGRTDYSGSAELGPGLMRYALGRIEVQDFSARVISGLSDGLKLEYQLGNVSIRLSGGYRGLLYKEDANSFIDADDALLFADDDKFFAPKRVFVGTGVRFTEFLPFHDFGLESWAQFDLEDGDTTTHTQYVEPFVEGRLGRSLRWRSWTAVEFGTSDSDMLLAMAAGLRLRYSAPEYAGLLVTGNALWASGDTTNLTGFTPIRRGSIATISSLSFTDTSLVGLEVSMSPMRGMSASLGGAALFRSSESEPAEGTIRDDADGYYLGTETTAQWSIRPASDLLISLWGGILVPNTSLYVSDTPNRWKVGMSAVFNM